MGNGTEILDAYTFETNSLLEQLETIVLEAEQANTFSQDSVGEIFRIMHTIKGSSAMLEYESLTTVAHKIEDLFFIIREKTMEVVPEGARSDLFDLLLQSIDFFRGEIVKVEANQPLQDNIDSFLIKIKGLVSKIKGEREAQPDPAPAPRAQAVPAGAPAFSDEGRYPEFEDFVHQLQVTFDEGCGMENLRAFMLVTSIRDACSDADFAFQPSDVETNPETAEQIIQHGFRLRFRNAEDRERAILIVKATGSVKSYQPKDCQPKAPAASEGPSSEGRDAHAPSGPTPPAANSPQAAAKAAAQHSKESLISVNLSKLDKLIAVVGEIVITESMVTASPDLKGLQLDTFTKSARQLRKLTDDLQDISMSLRMVPVSATFQKMNRVVRDMGKKLNKQVRLVLVGEDSEVDKTIVDSIGDPIMHIIRNSMDHGIEDTEAERIAAGKDPVGQITLSARDTGSEVIIEIKDDGRGVDFDKVLKKAIKNGLAAPDVDYSDREILNFLMTAGFSTNVQVTEYSGRGVGMDVVKKNVEEVGGAVSISSETGKGMTTTLKIPLTMAIMDGMEVSVGNSIFTIPINNIRQSFKVSARDIIHDAGGGEIIKVMDRYYPVIRARDLYELSGGYTDIEQGILIWLEAGECSYCLFVDELLGEQQVVVKQLPGYVNSYNIKGSGISGCTLLGDGSISIILDVGSLYTAAQSA